LADCLFAVFYAIDCAEVEQSIGGMEIDAREEFMVTRKQNGYSLLEMVITLCIALILSAVTFIAFEGVLYQSHVDSAYDTTLMALRVTRNLAITQSHEYYVNFNPAGFSAGTIQVEYQGPAVGGVLPALQQVITYTIPTDVQFAVQAGFPTNTPDGFGLGTTAIDFESAAAPGVPLACQCVVFYPDGSAQDTLGNYNSGVVYMTRSNDLKFSSRAVTVWGTTGRIRGWRLVQQGATWIWNQQ
jgi:prepilin-type N-terminal cleavage/methylation domain-containing protein